jgi:hypothetical protein
VERGGREKQKAKALSSPHFRSFQMKFKTASVTSLNAFLLIYQWNYYAKNVIHFAFAWWKFSVFSRSTSKSSVFCSNEKKGKTTIN